MAAENENNEEKSLIGLYDVETMTDKELKDYIGVLVEEKERVKLLLIQTERDRHEITDFLHNTNREILNTSESLIQKNFTMQKQLDETFHSLKQNERENLATELELGMKDAECNFKAFEKILLAKTQQGEEKRYQQRLLECVVREDEKADIDEKFVLFSRREKEEQRIVSEEKNLNELQTIAEKCIQTFHDSTYNFQKEKVDKIINIFESRVNDNIVRHPFSKYAEELAIYFEEILCKNLETTTALKKEVEKLGNELNNLQLLIRDSKRGNEQLKFNKHLSNTPTELNIQNEGVADQIEMKDEVKNAKINEDALYDLIYENDVLNEKLRNISKERDTLRNRFISSQRKIYQKSDFKSFLLEKMLFALQSKNIFPEIPTQYAILPKRKELRDISPVKDVPKFHLMIKVEGKSLSSH